MSELKKPSIGELFGNRVLIQRPEPMDQGTLSKIELLGDAKKQMESDAMKRWTRLKVAAVGNTIDVERLKVGDEVYIPSGVISSSEVVILDNQEYFMVRFDAIGFRY